ncbi:MAG TPA: DsrE family protein [Rhodocyclaceae bacterium]|nr:DsrE family protein [Rhodocyclaceae bacterium]
MKRVVAALAFGLALAAAGPARAAGPDAPAGGRLRVVVQVDEKETAAWNLVLNNVRNVQKEVGAGNVDIEVVAFGPGLDMLRDDSLVANRVQEAMAGGVRFVACRNTMQAEHLSDAEMVPGIGYVQAGVVEIIRKQAEGYSYLRP